MVARYFQQQIEAIARDGVLRAYGALLALVHLLAVFHWEFVQPAALLTSNELIPICWPFFEDCHEWRTLDAPSLRILLWAYGALSAVGAAVFWNPRHTRVAYFGLLVLAAIEIAVVVQDYRLRLNQHYMVVWATAVFAFAPSKRWALRVLLVAFYVWAGLLKLDGEWLSGEALHGKLPAFVPASLVGAACWYVVVLELLVVFGIFAKTRWIFWGTFAQLIVFHVTSFTVVGFYYPLLMFALLAILPADRLWPEDSSEPPRWRPMAAVVGAFSVLQLVPRAFPGDPALTGQGRLFALHMFDAKVACRAVAVVHESRGRAEPVALSSRLPARIACDPLVYFNFARGICRKRAMDPNFVDLDLRLRSRRGSEERTIDVVDIKSFCSQTITYDVLRANDWIRGE